MINIDNAFNTENRSVFEYYQRPGVGFYIPLYQREYSWDTDNIEQLLEDISKGVENLIENDENEIRFLGTIITVTETDKNKVQPQDTKALPPSIEKIIDGQQRLSTISILAALLYRHVDTISERLLRAIKKVEDADKEDIQNQVNEIAQFWKDKLKDIFSVDLKRGVPPVKPKIIRGSIDKWVMTESHNESYKSSVSAYLFQFIEHFFKNGEAPKFDRSSNAGKNLAAANAWIIRTVYDAHVNDNGFAPASSIIESISEENIWQYERLNLKTLINTDLYHDKNSFSYILSSFIQLLSVCHYLLDRCCFTVIQPVSENWAFDMFQSLNATGTPLTAIETFKPSVVYVVKTASQDFKGSIEDKYFSKIELAFEDLKSAAQKSKLTNDLLTSFALPIEGVKLATHFSSQRKWLEKVYEKRLATFPERQEFIKFFGNYSQFYHEIWLDYKGDNNQIIPAIIGSNDSELVSLLTLFLKDSNHKMAITVLGSFYHEVIEGKPDSISTFNNAVKTIASFYILWRAAYPNAGLDDVYRLFFKGNSKVDAPAHLWIEQRSFNLKEVKDYFRNAIIEKGLQDKKDWIDKAAVYAKYDNSYSISKFILFNTAHNTMPDPMHPGLMKVATPGTADFMRLERWRSPDLQHVEHIAPKENTDNKWSASLYEQPAELYQSIGNLTLLPAEVNISASNKGWKEKLIYYMHLSEKDPDKVRELANKANSEGIKLANSTIELLQQSRYSSHILPVLAYGEQNDWNAEIVAARTKRMLEIVWDRISPWVL
jgi:hypothetical protein